MTRSALVQALVGPARRVGIQDQMWARFALRLGAALDPAELVAGRAIDERAARDQGSGRDRTAAGCGRRGGPRPCARITAETAFGPDGGGGQPPHSRPPARRGPRRRGLRHRRLRTQLGQPASRAGQPHDQAGDAVVLDIGGTRGRIRQRHVTDGVRRRAPRRLRRRSTRCCARPRPRRARRSARACRPQRIDAAARDIIAEAGYGEAFLHRTGHGIGMETHEEPYIVASNPEPLRGRQRLQRRAGIYMRGHVGRADRGHRRLHRCRRRAPQHDLDRALPRRLTRCAATRGASRPALTAPGRSPHSPRGRRRSTSETSADRRRSCADDRVQHRRAEEEEGLDRLRQREARARGLGAIQRAHLLGLLQQQPALGPLRGGDVVDDQLEGALAPATELVALLGGQARLPGLAGVVRSALMRRWSSPAMVCARAGSRSTP